MNIFKYMQKLVHYNITFIFYTIMCYFSLILHPLCMVDVFLEILGVTDINLYHFLNSLHQPLLALKCVPLFIDLHP